MNEETRRCRSCGNYTAQYIGIQNDGGDAENVTVRRWWCQQCSETFDEMASDDTDDSQRD